MASGRRGDMGERREGFSGLRQASFYFYSVQMPGAGIDGGR